MYSISNGSYLIVGEIMPKLPEDWLVDITDKWS